MADHDAATSDLRSAVERLYEVMARHPRPGSIAFCDHCVSHEENARLLRVPLRQLTADDLDRYAWKSMSTWGDEADFRHFLPRLLDLVVTGQLDYLSGPDRLIQKTTVSGLSAEESAVVRRLLDAWWAVTLTRHPAPHTAYTVLEALSAAVDDPAPYLAVFEQANGQAHAQHLADLVGDWEYTSARDDAWSRSIERWMTSPTPARLLEAATLAADTPQVATALSEAYEHASTIYECHRQR
ncbi:hypothetical protein [Catellatospora methionotrophica]|uniref:hypothetical protein n=1 Tax=Catellatospora methionotrophica TaxID=121620 RepID=UPI00340D07A3